MSVPEDDPELAALRARQRLADAGGGEERQARRRKLGRLPVRDRIAALCDAGSFDELERFSVARPPRFGRAETAVGDGVVAGLARIDGRPVALVAHDVTVARGALGATGARKVCRAMDLALERGIPIVTLAESEGVRVGEGIDGVVAYGDVLSRHVAASGRVPQVGVAFGVCVGAAAYALALGDVAIVHREHGHLFITGAKVTRVVTGEEVTMQDLGGAAVHARTTGLAHLVRDDDAACLAAVREVLAYLPSRAGEPPEPRACDDPADRPTPELAALVPREPRRAYDARKLLARLFDGGSVLELSPDFGRSTLTAFARLAGRPIAVVASQTLFAGGVLDLDASRKVARFVHLASAHGLPVVTLVDVPGFMPGRKQEHGGILHHGASVLVAYGRATVPRVAVVLRKSYGGASVLSFAADLRLALPSARVAPVGAEAAFELLDGPAPDATDEAASAAREARRQAFAPAYEGPFAAAEAGYLDRVVAANELRAELSRALDALCAGRPRSGAGAFVPPL